MPHASAAKLTRFPALAPRLLLAAMMLCTSSCRQRGEVRHFPGPQNEQAEYLAHATAISYPDVVSEPVSDVNFALEPRRLGLEQHDETWNLTLPEAIQIALSNSQVIRTDAQFLANNAILQNPDFATSIYDPAIQESGVLFGRRGVEAALSDFDTQFTTQMLWGRNETIQNNTISTGLPAGSTLVDETGNFNASLRKRLATGAQVEVSHSWNYTGRNIPTVPFGTQLFPSVYEGTTQLQYRQPLLAGGGVEYTRIAGPISSNIQGVTGVQQGVIIARINNDMELADFEQAVQDLVHDVQSVYMQLHTTYRTYDTVVVARNQAMDLWRKVEAQRIAATGEGAAQLADLKDTYLRSQREADVQLDSIYQLEARLRRLLGLPLNDGTIIRPIDPQITAEYHPDWVISLTDALVHRTEIRKQKWRIKSFELQLRAAENLLMPRLDFVAAYRVNGFGDDLIGNRDRNVNGNPNNLGSAYDRLFEGDQTGWNLGFEFSVPIGRRFAHSQVRSLELELAKAQAMLVEQEVEVSHELADAFRAISRSYSNLELDYNRLITARERYDVLQAQYIAESERITLERLSNAMEGVMQAEVRMLGSILQYNEAILDLERRTGQTLTANGIFLAEGGWHPAAAVDALERFEEREGTIVEPYLHTEPQLYPEPILPREGTTGIAAP